MVHRNLGLAALGLAVSTVASAQTQLPGQPFSSSPDALLADWTSEYGEGWHLLTHPSTGTLEMLHGKAAEGPFEPDTNQPEDWFALARYWVRETYAMHGIEDAQLVKPRFRYLPLAQANTTDKITVRFEQVIAGVPVEQAAVNVLFDTQGRMLSLHTTAAPAVEQAGVRPLINAGFANLIAAEAFQREFGVEPTTQGNERLVHAWVDEGETRTWQLAWQVEANFDSPDQPIGIRYTIDALGRRVLKQVSTIHNVDVFGTVRANATPGTAADSSSNSPVPIEVPRTRLSSSAGTIETDRDGNFNFAGVNSPIDITLEYFGQFSDVRNSGADYTITFQNVQPGQQNDLLANPSPTQNNTAQANVQIHLNVLRDWIRDRFPTDSTADFRAVANVNINSSCNAFFNGSSVNFYTTGNGCSNTAFSTVVAHEMGHWLNVRYGTGNGSDGMGEGNADVFAMYLYDTPLVGEGFFTNGGNIRNGNNTRQFCGDASPGCYGQVHTDGQVWMGAAWKVRTQLNNSLGNDLGDLTSDLLFLGWMNSYNQTGIRSVIETQWLTLDDDNGDINDGTPNYAPIDAGFRAQGFPGFDLPFLTIDQVTEVADTISEQGPYDVSARVTANLGTTVSTVNVRYRVNGGPVQTAPLNPVGGDVFSGGIPGQISPSVVEYMVRATDSNGNQENFPEAGLAGALTFVVGNSVPILVTDFESASGWQGNAPGDNATTGIWTRANPRGTDAQPEDDFTVGGVNCWFTGQGSVGGSLGENDVDGGSTTLLSPVFDGSGAAILNLSYARWYSNNTGASPNADVFVVGVSTDGGNSWTNVEQVGPGGDESNGGWFRPSFDLAQIVTPTANMRLRFVASDLNDGSIVEAAIDDIELISLEPSLSPPSNYCTGNTNSTGQSASISVLGSQRISDNNLTLSAFGVPAGQFGIFFFSEQQANAPLAGSSGILCVGSPLFRLPVVQADPFFGTVSYAMDFTDNGSNASTISAGSTQNFQLWYRDLGTSNTSDGVTVEFGL